MDEKSYFIKIYNENIHREGAKELLDFLTNQSDFFTAPASAKLHSVRPGGLVSHSLNVYECLQDILDRPRMKDLYGLSYSDETIAVCGLLHDVCRIGHFATSSKFVKDESGQWQSVPCYLVDDSCPYGHGEKSVYIISSFMSLTEEEAFAIRFHAGHAGEGNPDNVAKALERYPLTYALVSADMEAAFIMEGHVGRNRELS